MIRRLMVNLATSLLAIVVFLALAEAILWVSAPPPKPPFPKGMFEKVGSAWQLAPNFSGLTDNRVDYSDKVVTSDGQGRRTVPSAPMTAEHRLWLLGDSQTFGHGLSDDETWANRLQQELLARGLSLKVINLGVPAINVDQYLIRIQIIKDEIQPGDKVLVGLS